MHRKDLHNVYIDDSSHEVDAFSYVCTYCARLYQSGGPPSQPSRHTGEPLRTGRHCDAFPDGHDIPITIWNGVVNHTETYEGAHGVRMESGPMVVDSVLQRILAIDGSTAHLYDEMGRPLPQSIFNVDEYLARRERNRARAMENQQARVETG